MELKRHGSMSDVIPYPWGVSGLFGTDMIVKLHSVVV